MKRFEQLAGLAVIVLACAATVRAEEDATRVFNAVRWAVVGLENGDGSGTGMIIDHDGLILTNAHVVTSALPYVCQVDVPRKPTKPGDPDFETLTFKNVKIVGFHPRLDMALVKINPKEHNLTLPTVTISKIKATTGQRVFALGDPGAEGMIMRKTLTTGDLSNTDRIIEGVPYYQHTAPINPGNSGGPLFNKAGEAIGMNTLKANGVEGIAFALRLFDFDASQFGPLSKRAPNRKIAREMIDVANEQYSLGLKLHNRLGIEVVQEAVHEYHESLIYDPTNPLPWYRIGVVKRAMAGWGGGDLYYDAATRYLLKSIEIEPWPADNVNVYRELGLALVEQQKPKEALLAWDEGRAKNPAGAAKIWEDLAIYWVGHDDPYKAAYAAAVCEHLGEFGTQLDAMRRMQVEVRRKLSEADRKKLDDAVAKIKETLQTDEKKSAAEHKAGHAFLNPEFAAYVKAAGSETP